MQNSDSFFHYWTDKILHAADGLLPERPLYAYQREFGHALIFSVLIGAAEELTALFARQAGKTETIARVSIAISILLPRLAEEHPATLNHFQSGLWIGIFAPVKEQARTSFTRMTEVLESSNGIQLLHECGVKITEANRTARAMSNGSFIRVWSASPGSHIESQTLHLAIVEEAQDVCAIKIQKSIEPMLTATTGTLVLVGTANGLKSHFHESIEHNRKQQYDAPSRKMHFEYDWTVVIRYNLRYRAFLNKKVLDRGKGWAESDAFKMAYGCIFVLERGQFLSISRLQALETLCENLPRGPYNDATKICTVSEPIVAGIDWGKSGDSTVVTLIVRNSECCRIVDWLEIVGDDYDSQFESIIAFLKRFPTLQFILSETNGVGDPMTDRLKKATRIGAIKAVVGGFVASETNNSDGYKNLLIDFVHANRLLLPADINSRQSQEYQNCISQLTSALKTWRGSLLKVHAPNQQHDDYLSSLMIAYWAASRLSTPDLFRQFFR
jgi:hypothetical protein